MFDRMLNGFMETWILLAMVMLICLLQACTSKQEVLDMSSAPYPPSQHIQHVVWDYSSIVKAAPGSDLWPVTWGRDGNLYTAWGDGGGFGGDNAAGRVTLGVAVINGSPESLEAKNLFGGKDPARQAVFEGKPTGILSVDGSLYMGIVEQDKWLRLKLGRSVDNGKSWAFNSNDWENDSGWDFAEHDGAFSDITFLQYGQDTSDGQVEYVYMYSQDKRADKQSHDIAMMRVHKQKLMDRKAYEYFAGMNQNKPVWTKNIASKKPVFSDPNTVGWGVRVIYSPKLDRYFLTTWHSENGAWGIFDAPQPWGPWTTVVYYRLWIDDTFKFGFEFPPKWLSNDGRQFVMVFSGVGKWDSWNTIKGEFRTRQSH